MPKRNLRVLKWLGTTPAIAVCTSCNREFRVPLAVLKRVGGAAENLKQHSRSIDARLMRPTRRPFDFRWVSPESASRSRIPHRLYRW